MEVFDYRAAEFVMGLAIFGSEDDDLACEAMAHGVVAGARFARGGGGAGGAEGVAAIGFVFSIGNWFHAWSRARAGWRKAGGDGRIRRRLLNCFGK
jgi:hypothetical protein